MIVTTLNRRYAKSILELANEQNKLEEVRRDMALIAKVIDSSRDLKVLLKSPVVHADKKQSILTEIFGNQLGELSNAFISIILRKGREAELEGIAIGFQNLYNVYKGIEEATITTANELTTQQHDEIVAKLKAVTGSQIEIKQIVDPSIIGGIKIRVGDKQYNGSIAYQLAQLKLQFKDNAYIADF